MIGSSFASRSRTRKAAEQQDLAQVGQRQPIAYAAEHHESNDVAGQTGPVQQSAATLVELPAAGSTPKPPVTPDRQLTPLRCGGRATANATLPASPTLTTASSLSDPPNKAKLARWHES
jgi:hypothetical protein